MTNPTVACWAIMPFWSGASPPWRDCRCPCRVNMSDGSPMGNGQRSEGDHILVQPPRPNHDGHFQTEIDW